MPTDTFEMPMIHRVLRRELGRLPELVVSSSADPTRRERVAQHARETLGLLHTHHEGEDTLLWPVLRPRVSAESIAVIDRMEASHSEVVSSLQKIDPEVGAWAQSGDPARADQLASDIRAMNTALFAHLDEEEAELLPIAAEHTSPEEWGKLGEHGFGAIPMDRKLFALATILTDASDEERSKFLSHVPPPAREAYEQFGEKVYQDEMSQLL
jgi:hemerythrin-like domain-containing protein